MAESADSAQQVDDEKLRRPSVLSSTPSRGHRMSSTPSRRISSTPSRFSFSKAPYSDDPNDSVPNSTDVATNQIIDLKRVRSACLDSHESRMLDDVPTSFVDVVMSKYSHFFHCRRMMPRKDWSLPRRLLAMLFSSLVYDVLLAAVLLVNVIVIINQTDVMSPKMVDGSKVSQESPSWCINANYVLNVIYSVELILRIYVYRQEFLHSASNLIDMFIIVGDVAVEVFLPRWPNFTGLLRLFRLLRLGRAVKLLAMFPELSMMLKGMMHAIRSIFWGMILVVSITTVWSIMAVQLIHPLNLEIDYGETCPRCPHAYETTYAALLTFTQIIVAGDSWGMHTMPIMEKHPWTYFFFISVLATVGMGILNLILAIIVDNSMEARKESNEALVASKEHEFRKAAEELENVCLSLDKDGNGVLTYDEIMTGFYENPEFESSMRAMDVTAQDMKTVFLILDEDKSGDVNYNEFVNQLYKLKSSDARTMQVFMQYYVQEILQRTTRQMAVIKTDISVTMKVMLNDLEELKKSAGLYVNPMLESSMTSDSQEPDALLQLQQVANEAKHRVASLGGLSNGRAERSQAQPNTKDLATLQLPKVGVEVAEGPAQSLDHTRRRSSSSQVSQKDGDHNDGLDPMTPTPSNSHGQAERERHEHSV